jgi:hypothetical protein
VSPIIIVTLVIGLLQGQFEQTSSEIRLPSDRPLTIALLDVDLDGSAEILIATRDSQAVAPYNLLSLTIFDLDDSTLRRTNLYPFTPELTPAPTLSWWRVTPISLGVFRQSDRLNQTYLGIELAPLVDPYVPGLLVVRWDDSQTTLVMFMDHYCPGGAWYVDHNGMLAIPVTVSVPWQGCVHPDHRDGIPVVVPGSQFTSSD